MIPTQDFLTKKIPSSEGMFALDKSLEYYKYIINPDHATTLHAMQLGSNLQYVKNQTYDICLAAVQNYGNAISWVENQTEELNLCAVRTNGMALRFVKNQTYNICLTAVKQYGDSLRYVLDEFKTEELLLCAIDNCPSILHGIKEPTTEMVFLAICKDLKNLSNIKKVTPIIEELIYFLLDQDYRNISHIMYIDNNYYDYILYISKNNKNIEKLFFSSHSYNHSMMYEYINDYSILSKIIKIIKSNNTLLLNLLHGTSIQFQLALNMIDHI
jgi:hypothetical protein